MTAVGDAAFEMIEEIRRQFREIPGLLEGKAEPDNANVLILQQRQRLTRCFYQEPLLLVRQS